MSNCAKCGASIEGQDACEFAGESLCEDCYLEQRVKPITCDPWAVYTARNTSGKARQMSDLERLISSLTHKSYGSKEPETDAARSIRFGRLPDATAAARVTGPCGETMEIYLYIEGEEIRDGSFFTDGCGASRLCGAVALTLAIGKNLDDAAMIEGDTLLGMIENLPEDHQHCAHLAAGTLQTALHNYVALPEHRHHLPAPSPEH